SPLAPEGFDWVRAKLGEDVWLFSTSGGTDVCTAFVGGVPLLPVYRGELQGRALGAKVEAFDEDGNFIVDEVGELVITEPMPSMPLYLWGDADGSRYHASYFDVYPGVWRHGDWITLAEDGSCVIHGRSDATINRHGVRMGSSEIYAAVESLPEILDSMVIDLEYLGRESWMALFVVPRAGVTLDQALTARIREAIRTKLSPRFLPDAIVQAPEVPRTLSGKKQEVPIKKLFLGLPLDKVVNRAAMANPQCLDWYQRQAAEHAAARVAPPA
ncbi:MAG TPA: hypothetical protein VI299_07745, partial [Polyangiales bacterium]